MNILNEHLRVFKIFDLSRIDKNIKRHVITGVVTLSHDDDRREIIQREVNKSFKKGDVIVIDDEHQEKSQAFSQKIGDNNLT